jgi:site-specific DNA-methyltransferase (adenine-specific)
MKAGKSRITDVITCPVGHDKESDHPARYPVALCETLITTFSEIGTNVCDPFSGSGSTAIACINTDRNYIGFELDADYHTKATERIVNHHKPTSLDSLFETIHSDSVQLQ